MEPVESGVACHTHLVGTVDQLVLEELVGGSQLEKFPLEGHILIE